MTQQRDVAGWLPSMLGVVEIQDGDGDAVTPAPVIKFVSASITYVPEDVEAETPARIEISGLGSGSTVDLSDEGIVDNVLGVAHLPAQTGQFRTVRAKTTANITLSGAQTIDGVSIVAGDRVLVADQSTGANRGIYVAAAGAWARAADWPTGTALITSGATVRVSEGTDGGGKAYYLSTTGAINVGTTSVAFTEITSDFAAIIEGTTAEILATTPTGMAVGFASDATYPDSGIYVWQDSAWLSIGPSAQAGQFHTVRASAFGNLTLSGAQTIDGVSCIAGDRVLAPAQTSGAQNGIYVVAAGAWTRAADWLAGTELVASGATVYVSEGTVLGKTRLELVTTGAINVGTTATVFRSVGADGPDDVFAFYALTIQPPTATSGAGVARKIQGQTAATGSGLAGGTVEFCGGDGDGAGDRGKTLLGKCLSLDPDNERSEVLVPYLRWPANVTSPFITQATQVGDFDCEDFAIQGQSADPGFNRNGGILAIGGGAGAGTGRAAELRLKIGNDRCIDLGGTVPSGSNLVSRSVYKSPSNLTIVETYIFEVKTTTTAVDQTLCTIPLDDNTMTSIDVDSHACLISGDDFVRQAIQRTWAKRGATLTDPYAPTNAATLDNTAEGLTTALKLTRSTNDILITTTPPAANWGYGLKIVITKKLAQP